MQNLPIQIHKFGGTSLGDAKRLQACAELMRKAATASAVVVVTSAMAGTTDGLMQATSHAAAGDLTAAMQVFETLQDRHRQTTEELGVDWAHLQALHADLAASLQAIVALGELSLRSKDRILCLGEKCASRLLQQCLQQKGVASQQIDADTFLETNANYGEATPLHGVAERSIYKHLQPELAAGKVVVVTGYCGHAPDGSTTTLGRGGSDYTASLLAEALKANDVFIWTDVDGVYSTDPRMVPEARRVPQLNYREAAEISFYGAKVLHPRTLAPVASHSIPVHILNSMQPDLPGTVVDGSFTPGSHPVKAIGAVKGQTLVSVEGKGMVGVPGIAERVFGALAHEGISVTMISQSSSEASICLAVPDAQGVQAEVALKRAFRQELSYGSLEDIVLMRQVSLVAVVGLGMAHTPGVAARLCQALGHGKINILALAQGSSELNITVAVAEAQTTAAVRALHFEFDLHRLDTGEDTTRRLDLVILGFGKIGQALARLLHKRQDHIAKRFGLEARVACVVDRKSYLFQPRGLSADELNLAQECKAAGGALLDLPAGVAMAAPQEMLEAISLYRLARPVLIDVSDADGSADLFLQAFAKHFDVVTANKKPLSGSYAEFEQLMAATTDLRPLLKAEATVGAGLPVVDTLEMLLATGDSLHKVEGCFSGTLAFIFAELEKGEKFSSAVLRAVELGYTEPDPVVDLSGMDVARKALILGRLAGFLVDDSIAAQGDPLVDLSLLGSDPKDFAKALTSYDATMQQRVQEAKSKGMVLRYLASVEAGKIAVGVKEVAMDSTFGMLKGTENVMVFTSENYAETPLVVMGPGAGVEITAMGVLGDVLRVAAERN